MELRTRVEPGSILEVRAGDNTAAAHATWSVLVTGALVDEDPHLPLAGAASFKKILQNPQSEAIFLGTGRLSRGLRVSGEAAARDAVTAPAVPVIAVTSSEQALYPGHTTRVDLLVSNAAETSPEAPALAFPEVSLLLHRSVADRVDAGFLFRMTAATRVAEFVAVDGEWSTTPLVWSFPLRPQGPWLIGSIDISPRTPEGPDVVVLPQGDAASVVDIGVTPPDRPGAARLDRSRFDASWEPLLSTLEMLSWSATRRRALAHLARSGGAELALDLAVAADDDVAEALASTVLRAARTVAAPPDSDTMAVFVEHCALVTLSELEETPVGVHAIARRHLGAVARYPSSYSELASGAATTDVIRDTIVGDNVFLLQDRALSVRVRAWEWLADRGVTIDGYDAEATPADRRRALARYLQQQDAQGGGE